VVQWAARAEQAPDAVAPLVAHMACSAEAPREAAAEERALVDWAALAPPV